MPYLRKYGTGTGADVIIPIPIVNDTDFSVAGTWTPGAGDVKVSKDGGAAANIGTLPVFVTSIGWKFVFSDAELTCARLNVIIVDAALENQFLNIETYGNASAQHAMDFDATVPTAAEVAAVIFADQQSGVVISGTAGAVGATTITLPSGAFAANELQGATAIFTDSNGKFGQRVVVSNTGANPSVVTVDTWTTTPSGTVTVTVFSTPPANATNLTTVDVTKLGGDTQSATDLKDFADAGYDPGTNKVQGVVLVDTSTTVTGGATGTEVAAVQTEVDKIGTIPALDSAAQTIGAAIGKLADDNAGASYDATTDSLTSIGADTDTLVGRISATIFANMTSLAQWLGAMAGKQASDATAQTEMRATGAASGTFDATADSLEANRDNIGTSGAGLSDLGGMSTGMKAEVNAEADTANTDYDAATGAELAATEAKVDTVISTLGTAGAGLTDLGAMSTAMKAEVNAEVKDVTDTDTSGEPAQGAPSATLSMRSKIDYMFKHWRNKKTQTATEYDLFADDGTTVDQKATISDDGTTATKGEIGTGP